MKSGPAESITGNLDPNVHPLIRPTTAQYTPSYLSRAHHCPTGDHNNHHERIRTLAGAPGAQRQQRHRCTSTSTSLGAFVEQRARLVPTDAEQYDPLIPPALLRHDLPVPSEAFKTISTHRQIASDIVQGLDPEHRLLVVVGPCSIHDVDQAKEYAARLRKGVVDGRWPALEVVMRVYL